MVRTDFNVFVIMVRVKDYYSGNEILLLLCFIKGYEHAQAHLR